MGFSAPKPKPPPPLPDPIPIPEIDEGDAMKKQRKRTGKSSTVLTGDLVPETTGQTVLGGRV